MLNFDEELMRDETSEELKKLKVWMFQEHIKIQAKSDELQEISRELVKMKRELEKKKTILDLREQTLEKRFGDNEELIAKKKKIIEDAYDQLNVDKKALECERLNFEHEKNRYRRQKMAGGSSRTSSYQQSDTSAYDNTSFFRGVNNELELRKRYKELLKIFHPDNKCGDTKTLIKIQTEYENLRSRYNEG